MRKRVACLKTTRIPRNLLLRAAFNRAARFREFKERQEDAKKDEKRKKQLDRRMESVGELDRRIKSLESHPSRIAVTQLREIIESPDTPPLQKTHASAILLRWTTGDLSKHDGRRQPRRRNQATGA